MSTEAEVVRDLTNESKAAQPVIVGGTQEIPVLAVPLPPGWVANPADSEQWAAAPRRAKGTVHVHDAESFARAVRQRAMVDEIAVYADVEHKQLVAVLNDDLIDSNGDQVPDWRDYRVELQLRPRPEWTHWRRIDGQYVDQETFAEHIEHGLPELVHPAAAEALEIAQTFQANVSARFKQGSRLRDGAQQFTYDEEIEATAGQGGLLTIPHMLVIRVAPFFGADLVDVQARFRFRLRSGALTLGYLLDRPDDVERAAFQHVVSTVAESLSINPIAGLAPSAR